MHASRSHAKAPRKDPTLCGRRLGVNRHVCALFSRPGIDYDVMLPYLREGLEQGDKILEVVPTGSREAHVRRLAEGGIPPEAIEDPGFVLRDWDETYLSGAGFSADAMRDRVLDFVSALGTEGRARTWGDMNWIHRVPEAQGEVIRYEKMADDVHRRFPHNTFVCSYDVSKISGKLVMELARVHPVVVFDGVLYENSV